MIIALAAAVHVRDGETAMLDDGTTCAAPARHLAVRNDLRVPTNNLLAVTTLAKASGLRPPGSRLLRALPLSLPTEPLNPY